jgi:hypothetical protein
MDSKHSAQLSETYSMTSWRRCEKESKLWGLW